MSTTITAIYEEGVFKPLEDIFIQEHQRVEIIVNPVKEEEYDLDDATDSIKEGLKEVALHKAGKLKTKSFKELMNEL